MKLIALITAAGLLSCTALLAEDPDAVALSVDLGSGTGAALAPIASGPAAEIAPPTTPDEAEALEQTLYGQGQALDDAPAEPAAQSRAWKFNFHASANSYYDSNIYISAARPRADFVTEFTAGGGVTLGDYTARQNNYLVMDYSGVGEVFGRYAAADAYGQLASIETQVLLGHLTMHGTFQFQDTSDEDIDTGDRTRRQIYTGNGSARDDISDKTYIQATVQVTISNYSLYLGSNDERGGLFFNYLPNPDITLGLGLAGGVLHVDDSSSQTYEQLLSSLQAAATGKFTLNASAGVEDRQVPGNGSIVTPVFDLSGDYKPLAGLDLDFAAYRQVANSAYYAGADYIATGVSVTARYEISPRFTGCLGAGYVNSAYRDISAGTGISREDNYYYVRPSLRYTASASCTIELYCILRRNDSTFASDAFKDAQIGISVSFTF